MGFTAINDLPRNGNRIWDLPLHGLLWLVTFWFCFLLVYRNFFSYLVICSILEQTSTEEICQGARTWVCAVFYPSTSCYDFQLQVNFQIDMRTQFSGTNSSKPKKYDCQHAKDTYACVVFAFMLCWTLTWLITVLTRLRVVANMPRNIQLSSAINPFIYVGMNPLSSSEFRRIMCCKSTKKISDVRQALGVIRGPYTPRSTNITSIQRTAALEVLNANKSTRICWTKKIHVNRGKLWSSILSWNRIHEWENK